MTAEPTRPILILGVGNLLLRDEGVGVHVARYLQTRQLPPDVEVLDGATGGMELLGHLRDRRRVVFVDAIDAAGPPGTVVHAFLDENVPVEECVLSAHDQSIPSLLHTARLLGFYFRAELVGIIPADHTTLDPELSPRIRSAVPEIAAKVLGLLTDLPNSDPPLP